MVLCRILYLTGFLFELGACIQIRTLCSFSDSHLSVGVHLVAILDSMWLVPSRNEMLASRSIALADCQKQASRFLSVASCRKDTKQFWAWCSCSGRAWHAFAVLVGRCGPEFRFLSRSEPAMGLAIVRDKITDSTFDAISNVCRGYVSDWDRFVPSIGHWHGILNQHKVFLLNLDVLLWAIFLLCPLICQNILR